MYYSLLHGLYIQILTMFTNCSIGYGWTWIWRFTYIDSKKKSESVMFSWVLRTGDVETFCLSGFGGISKLYQHLEMAEPDTNTRSMETSFLI